MDYRIVSIAMAVAELLLLPLALQLLFHFQLVLSALFSLFSLLLIQIQPFLLALFSSLFLHLLNLQLVLLALFSFLFLLVLLYFLFLTHRFILLDSKVYLNSWLVEFGLPKSRFIVP